MKEILCGLPQLINLPSIRRLRIGACGFAIVLFRCGDSDEAGWVSAQTAGPARTLGAKGELSNANRRLLEQSQSPPIAMPGQVVRSKIGPASDSTSAIRIATQVLSDRSNRRFRVTLFVNVDRGFLIQMQPDPVTVGGGGLLWIEPDGRAQVLRRYR